MDTLVHTPAELAIIASFSDVEITRTLSHNGECVKPGRVCFEYSYKRDGVSYSSAICITRDWEDANDVQDYIRRAYIYKDMAHLFPGIKIRKKPASLKVSEILEDGE